MNLARATRWVSAPLALGVGLLAIAIPSAMAQTDWGVRKVYYEGENRGRGEGNYHNSVNNNPVIRATYRDLVDDNKAVYVEGEFWHYEYACSPSTCYWDWFKKDEQQTTHSQSLATLRRASGTTRGARPICPFIGVGPRSVSTYPGMQTTAATVRAIRGRHGCTDCAASDDVTTG
jgi:hypothetical protein